MKLYYFPGACSLAPHIVARESGMTPELVKVEILGDKSTSTGEDYAAVNPRGYVPAIMLEDGAVHTEVAFLIQWLGDRAPGAGLMPVAGTPERAEVQKWIAYIASDLHRGVSPWLFIPTLAPEMAGMVRGIMAGKLAALDAVLTGKSYLVAERFSAADAYAFVVLNWSGMVGIDLAPYPSIRAYLARIAARPKVREAMVAEGLVADRAA